MPKTNKTRTTHCTHKHTKHTNTQTNKPTHTTRLVHVAVQRDGAVALAGEQRRERLGLLALRRKDEHVAVVDKALLCMYCVVYRYVF